MPIIETEGAASSQGFGQFARQVSGPAQAEAIDFNGTTDVLSRANLDGNTSSRTFTFSAFFYRTSANNTFIYNVNNSSLSQFFFITFNNGNISITGRNSGGTNILVGNGAGFSAPLNTWISVLVSVDLASTGSRSVYINDRLFSMSWGTYTNQQIAFSQTTHTVGAYSTTYGQQRLSNVFLDYTYRDLSVEANRRLFVTADLKPAAGQAALNPIMYLPMANPTNPGLNQGTGGNFALEGVVARSGRGPNQYNAPYSTLDGANDFLQRETAPSGIADGKQFTFNCVFNPNNIAANNTIISFSTAGNQRFAIWHNNDGQLTLFARNSSGTTILNATVTNPTFVISRNYVVTVSVDLSDSGRRHIYINGVVPTTINWNTYTNENIDFAFTDTPTYNIGCANGTVNFFNGRLGALWFNTSYLDLSVAANRAKFVTGTGINAAPADPGATGQLPTGTSPLIYLPMYGNDAGRNYGTGGDFSFISGAYTGARGPNEYWGNFGTFNGSSSRLTRTTGVGLADGKTFSMSFWFRPTSGESGDFIFNIGNDRFGVRRDTSDKFNFYAGSVLNAASNSSIPTDNIWYHALVCIDMSNTAKRFVYINGTQYGMTWTTYSNSNIAFSGTHYTIGGYWDGTYSSASTFAGDIGDFYFTTEYIDFSEYANRLKFRDAFGNPVNLTQQIESLAIPNPAIFMRFDPTAFGTNLGTGGNFDVNAISGNGQF